MKRWLAALACLFALEIGLAQAIEVEGVKFEPTINVGGQTLQLNGAGLRTRLFFKVYAAGLYVPQRSGDAAALLAQKGARRVTISMLRDVDAETFVASLNDGLRANLTEAQLAAIKGQIDALNATMKAIGEAKKGDAILFEFVPTEGTRITVNGKPQGNVLPGEEFFAAILHIWLGDKPVDASLKKSLLGG
jgi:hypothetical protein